MKRIISIGVLVVIACAVTAKPVREAPKTNWGTFEDPDKDCIFTEEKGVLSVALPGKDHDLAVERDKMNSPRALQPIDGDFTIEVKVSGKFEPRQMDSTERLAYHGAGIYVRKDDNNYITLDRATLWNGQQDVAYVNFEMRASGRNERFGTPTDMPLDNTQDTWLKIERKGNVFKAYAAQEAGKWQPVGERTMDVPKRVPVGIAARNSSTEPFTPRFAEFKLKAIGGIP